MMFSSKVYRYIERALKKRRDVREKTVCCVYTSHDVLTSIRASISCTRDPACAYAELYVLKPCIERERERFRPMVNGTTLNETQRIWLYTQSC